MRAAPLARDRVDVVDVLGAEIEQELRDIGDQDALANTRLEVLGDVLVGAIDHRASRVEQQDLVDRLDLPGVEHHLLAVEDRDALVGEGREHRRLTDVDADRHVGRALGPEDVADLARGGAEQAGVRSDGAAQADHPGMDVLGTQPGTVQSMVLRRRPEVPDVGISAAGQQRVAGHLVAGPLPDVCARDVPDVVEVEEQDGSKVRGLERRACPREPVRPQPLDVPALFPVDVHRARRREPDGHRVASPLSVGMCRRSAVDGPGGVCRSVQS